jgi:hypothetical protein
MKTAAPLIHSYLCTMNIPSPKLTLTKLFGSEAFTSGASHSGYSTLDFWSWAFSDLASNANRGVLAEFIVAKALGIELDVRNEWGDYDLDFNGLKIEVKSSAFIQSWAQAKHSSPRFDIRKRKNQTDSDTGKYVKRAEPIRPADIYVFALLEANITDTSDPLNLDHWKFYALTSAELNEKFGESQSLSLAQLTHSGAEGMGVGELQDYLT